MSEKIYSVCFDDLTGALIRMPTDELSDRLKSVLWLMIKMDTEYFHQPLIAEDFTDRISISWQVVMGCIEELVDKGYVTCTINIEDDFDDVDIDDFNIDKIMSFA